MAPLTSSKTKVPAGRLTLLGSLSCGCIEVYVFLLLPEAHRLHLQPVQVACLLPQGVQLREGAGEAWALAASSRFWEVGKGRGPGSGHPQGWGKAQVPAAPGEARGGQAGPCAGPCVGAPHAVTAACHPQQLPGQLALRQRCFEREGEVSQVTVLGLGPR